MKKVLITGAGTGFGHEVAMRLALKGFDVIAAVEIYAQVQTLKREAAARGVTLRVEKLDVTNEGDRKKALAWNIEILVNNAGVLEGGSVLDIPGSNMRHEFEVNVIGPLLLTQGIAKQMVKRATVFPIKQLTAQELGFSRRAVRARRGKRLFGMPTGRLAGPV